jgi:hypothetical protein
LIDPRPPAWRAASMCRASNLSVHSFEHTRNTCTRTHAHTKHARTPCSAVCRLPALCKLYALHMGPRARPGADDAGTAGSFRLDFKSGEEDRQVFLFCCWL